MLVDLSTGIVELKRDEVLAAVKARIERKEDPMGILEDARRAMVTVGNKFKEGEVFLAEMLLSAEIFKEIKRELLNTQNSCDALVFCLSSAQRRRRPGRNADARQRIVATASECAFKLLSSCREDTRAQARQEP